MTGLRTIRATATFMGVLCSLTIMATVPVGAAVKRTPDALRIKPDIVLSTPTVARTGVLADGRHQVRLSATVRCASSAATVSCGTFKIRAERSDDLGRTYTFLAEAGIASLGSGGVALVGPAETRFFDDVVAAGNTRTYRVTADSSSMVDESNEGNNVKTVRYTATGCPGSDLALTKVQLIRDHSGGALVHVWVANRCLEDCTASIVYVMDVSEALDGGGLGVEQPIGTRIPANTEVGPLGTTVAPGRATGNLTYTVSIETRGGPCRETTTTNTSCRVTLRASETDRTFTCR
ncbi:MAG: hypothetical protein HY825_20700 [Acidobacteria bacterium]|nr:hypothetical protein [Acidobacteriota bacterium]